MKHLKDLFTKNIGLKILSAIIAIVIWLVIVNIEDPEKSKVYTVPVTIENEDYLQKLGKVYEVQFGSDEVSFTVAAKRSVIEELSKDDFTATADLKQIDLDTGEVPIAITSDKYGNRLEYSNRNQHLQLALEDMQTLTLPVEVIPTGTVAENCIITSTETSPKKIEVSGAESVLANVSGAQVQIEVSGASDTVKKKEPIVLVDENSNKVRDTEGLMLSKKKVNVTVDVKMSKTLSLKPELIGTPADGYSVQSVILSRDSVSVTGETSVLHDLEFLDLESDQLNLTGRKTSLNAALNLTEFIPEGVSLAEGESTELKVEVVIDKNS